MLKIPQKIPLVLQKTQSKPRTIFEARFLRRLYCASHLDVHAAYKVLARAVVVAADQLGDPGHNGPGQVNTKKLLVKTIFGDNNYCYTEAWQNFSRWSSSSCPNQNPTTRV